MTTFTYDHARNLTDTAFATGRVDRVRYKNFERIEQLGNALNEFVTFAYDVPTLTKTITSARRYPEYTGTAMIAQMSGQFSTVEKIDSLGRTRQQIGNNGQQVTLTYDSNGNLKTRTDAASRATTYDYDPLNRVTKTTLPDGGVIQYGYDARGRLATVTDPRLLVTTYTYNGFGDILSVASPDTGITTYTYDSGGLLATESRANGASITYTFDKLGRKKSKASAGHTEMWNL